MWLLRLHKLTSEDSGLLGCNAASLGSDSQCFEYKEPLTQQRNATS
jgi:hypothetical protein